MRETVALGLERDRLPPLAPSMALMTETSESMLTRPMAANTDSMVRAAT